MRARLFATQLSSKFLPIFVSITVAQGCTLHCLGYICTYSAAAIRLQCTMWRAWGAVAACGHGGRLRLRAYGLYSGATHSLVRFSPRLHNERGGKLRHCVTASLVAVAASA